MFRPHLSRPCVAAVCLVLATAGSGRADDLTPRPTMGEILRLDARAAAILAPDATIEVLASGLDWSEGPVWIPRDDRQPHGGGYVIFSDVPRNRAYRWKEGEGLSVFLEPSGYQGFVTLEYEAAEDPFVAVPRHLRELRDLLA